MPNAGHLVRQLLLLPGFKSSSGYWENRYRLGGTSGEGSYGPLAEFKARVLNTFVREHGIRSVMELGCGDGNQLALASYPSYVGLDVSLQAVKSCRRRFAGDPQKSFIHYVPGAMPNLADFLSADATLSLDVVYHLVEDEVYERHLSDLFSMSAGHVVVYSSDRDERAGVPHVRHRNVTADVAKRFPTFRLAHTIENEHPDLSPCSFFIYRR